jgi:integrase
MRTKITKAAVDALRPGAILADTEIKGFVCRKLPSGTAAFGYRYRFAGRQRWLPIGLFGSVTADAARTLAKAAAGERARDKDPAGKRAENRAASGTTVNAAIDAFLHRQRSRGLRSVAVVERMFSRQVRGAIGRRSIYELTRREVMDLLDEIEATAGPVAAQKVLTNLRAAFDHWSTRDERFRSPLAVRGLNRIKASERARSRVLSDEEICDLWRVLEAGDATLARYTKALLLSGRRRAELAGMKWEEISGGDLWVIPPERSKSKAEIVQPVTAAFKALLGPPREAGFVFGAKGFSHFSGRKAEIDAALAALREREGRVPVPGWRWHDLRRTCRTLLSRAKVPADVAEMVLGHKLGGVRAVYDRHDYEAEKRDALDRLAALIDRIVDPLPADVVIHMKR